MPFISKIRGLRARIGHHDTFDALSAAVADVACWGRVDEISTKTDIGQRMSPVRG